MKRYRENNLSDKDWLRKIQMRRDIVATKKRKCLNNVHALGFEHLQMSF